MTTDDIDRDEQLYDATVKQAIDPLPSTSRTATRRPRSRRREAVTFRW